MDVATSDASQLKVLREACDKRTAAEIEIESLDVFEAWPRARLVGTDREAVYIDRPVQNGLPLELNSGEPTIVHFYLDGERYTFHSRIGRECVVPGPEHMQGVALSLPESVQRHERRTDCRVSLAGCEEVIGEFRGLPPDGRAPFPARLMNISAGGVAAIAIDVQDQDVVRGRHYQLQFQLPGVKRTFCFRTELCYLRRGQGGLVIMGLKYLPESDPAEMRHAIRQISQFVARELKKKSPTSTKAAQARQN